MISWSDQCPIDRGIPDHHIENLKIWLSRDRMSGSRTQSAGPRSIVVSRRTNIRTAAECRQAAGRGGRLAPVCSRSGAIPPVGTGLIQRTSWQAGTGAIPIWLALVRVVGGHKAAASIVTPPVMPSRAFFSPIESSGDSRIGVVLIHAFCRRRRLACMARSLSVDLRRRVVGAIEGGLSCRAAAQRFGVSASSAIRWRAMERREGDIRPKRQGGDRHSQRIEAHA